MAHADGELDSVTLNFDLLLLSLMALHISAKLEVCRSSF